MTDNIDIVDLSEVNKEEKATRKKGFGRLKFFFTILIVILGIILVITLELNNLYLLPLSMILYISSYFRLQDLGRNGAYVMGLPIPFYGFYLIILMLFKGKNTSKKEGIPIIVILLGLLFLIANIFLL